MGDELFDIPDEALKTEGEINQRIAEKQKLMALLSPLDDYNKWLDLNDSVKKLRKRLEDILSPAIQNTVNKETVEERLKREARERYEKRREQAGDNWWEMLD